MKNSIPSGAVQFFEPISSIRRSSENKLISLFTSKGYQEIVTSLFSYENSIFDGLFEPLKTQLFKVVDKNSGQTMILRADITMQITQAIMMGDFDMPTRICYADNIYRDVLEHSGQKREFRQTGVELFGIRDLSADKEVIELAISALKSLGLDNLSIRISDTYILENLLKKYGIEDKKTIDRIKDLLNRKNIAHISKMSKELPEGFIQEINLLNKRSGYFNNSSTYVDLDKHIVNNVVNLAQTIQEKHDIDIFIDLFYCEYPMYHHGIVFDIFSKNTKLVIGGRYGNVTKPFGRYIPATGFAINLDELTQFLFEGDKSNE